MPRRVRCPRAGGGSRPSGVPLERQDRVRPQVFSGSETALTQEYGLAKDTVRRAVAQLRELGWVYTVPRRGTYVSPREGWPER
ncbi:GntR family transcriptional regulator [Nonomuraea dietziae]|uniref:GntR family transcriptional regulator n=1 Tax=Nonomuraea dietziae TaxID=65515 RepID=UPI00342B36F1